jgi:hypothetical protein
LRAFFGSRISDNIAKTPEGYLIARNVPIARTGWQDYRASEIGAPGDGAIRVWRSPDEVFHSATIASFEGKSVTDGHPPEFVGPSNEGSYGRGHAQHIRRGGALDGDEGNEALLADLVVKDANLISKIEGGLREISCGYDCEYVPLDGGGFAQRAIRGNHIAVVPNGRAGDRVCIRDERPQGRRPITMSDWHKKIMGLGIKAFAKDAEPEDVASAIAATQSGKRMRMADQEEEEEPEPKQKEKPTEPDKKTSDAFDARLTKLCDAVEKLVARDAKYKKDEEKPEPEEKEETEDSELIPVETLAPDELPENPIPGADRAKDALQRIKPLVAKSKDAQAIQSWNDAWRALNPRKTGGTGDGYTRLLRTKKPGEVVNAEARAAMRTHDKEVDPSADFVAKARQFHRKNPGDVAAQLSKGVN